MKRVKHRARYPVQGPGGQSPGGVGFAEAWYMLAYRRRRRNCIEPG